MPPAHRFSDRWNHNTQHYPRVAELIADCPVVLDVGCGEGTLARYLAELGHQVIGVDRDPAILPADSAGTHFMLGDATGLPFAADSFDAVVSVMVLHQTQLELALVEMRRVLRPGGLLIDLGYARDKGIGELLRSACDIPVDLLARRGTTAWEPATAKQDAKLGWAETRQAIEKVLPDLSWQRLPGWRYLATWRRPSQSSSS